MKAVILAAGEGTRLRPFTSSEPKVMIPVANKPILQYVVEALVNCNIRDIVMVVGYHKQRIMSYFGNGDEFGADIEYIEQPKQLGTAHALYQVRHVIDDDFILLPGDNLVSEATVKDLIRDKKVPSVLITSSDHPSKYGVVSMENGVVNNIVEKPGKSKSHLISTGIYYLSPDVFPRIRKFMLNNIYDLTSVLNSLKIDRSLYGINTESMWMDAVYPWDLISLNSAALDDVAARCNGKVEEDVTIKGPVVIGEGTLIKGGTYIEGPVVIGEGCEIGPQACILSSSSIDDDCLIGPQSVVHNSMIMGGVKIGPKSILDSSVLGEGVISGAGLVSHVDTVKMVIEDHLEMVRSIGCMIAEDTVIGGGVTCYPGVIVGNECDIRTGVVLREKVPPGSTVL
ncbi:MAG: sugar phosphate nucleotidyltransferase [Thermoplasmata archaeon]